MRLRYPLIQRILILVLPLASFLSCEQISPDEGKRQTSFDTEYYEMDFILLKNSRSGFHIFAEEVFSSELSSVPGLSGMNEDHIHTVLIKEANISLPEPIRYTDFNMLGFIEFTVYTDSLGDEKIAWSDPVPRDRSAVSLDLADKNMLPYFKEDKFILTVQGYLNEPVYENIGLHAKVNFEVRGEF